MNKFNETVQTIKHNEDALLLRIRQLEKGLRKVSNSTISIAKDILSQILYLLNITLSIIQDIENSLEFCHVGIVHPSIITNNELINELNKISPFYKNKLPFEISHKYISAYKKIMKPTCTVKNSEIIYTLSIPIFDPNNYELIYLLPIPNKNFELTIPNSKYVLVSDAEILPMIDKCDSLNNQYLCSQQSKAYHNTSCEKTILENSITHNCSRFQMKPQQILEYIPEANKYLGVFPTPTPMQMTCKDTVKYKDITGILLFDNDENCNYTIGMQNLIFNDTTFGQPMVLENFHTTIENPPTLPEITLQSVQLAKLSNNLSPIQSMNHYDGQNNRHLSAIIIIYVCLVIIIITFLVIKYPKEKDKFNLQTELREVEPMDIDI